MRRCLSANNCGELNTQIKKIAEVIYIDSDMSTISSGVKQMDCMLTKQRYIDPYVKGKIILSTITTEMCIYFVCYRL